MEGLGVGKEEKGLREKRKTCQVIGDVCKWFSGTKVLARQQQVGLITSQHPGLVSL